VKSRRPLQSRDEGLALVAARNEHLRRGYVASRGLREPAVVVARNAIDARAELQIEPVLARMVLEVRDQHVAATPCSSRRPPSETSA
jgi:hypothetical protein